VPYQSSGSLLIGSQLLDAANSAHGYWGLDGKFNAVKVSENEPDPGADFDIETFTSTLTSYYEFYEPLTANW